MQSKDKDERMLKKQMSEELSLLRQVRHYQEMPELAEMSVNQDEDSLASVIRNTDTSSPGFRRSLVTQLSEHLGAKKGSLCMIMHRSTTQDQQKRWGAFLKYEYNPPVNELLKTFGRTMFYKPEKAWRLCLDDPDSDFSKILDELSSYFSYLVDLETGLIYQSVNDVDKTVSASAFSPMDFHIMVTHASIRGACDRREEKAIAYDAEIELWHNKAFIDLPDLPDPFWVTIPFLLLRVRKSSQPRYVAYHVLAKEIETITYGPTSKETATLFARYIGALEENGITQFLETDPDQVIPDTPERRLRYQGDFEPFWWTFDYVRSRITDLRFAPLSSHYAVLSAPGLGKDAGVYSNTMAYVWDPEYQPMTIRGIQKYFGYNDEHLPVIFSARLLSNLTPHMADDYGEFGSIRELLVHELAHHLRSHENLVDEPQDVGYPHDVCWAICHEVLDQCHQLKTFP